MIIQQGWRCSTAEEWPGAARVLRYPFADHHAPALRALHAFCERAAAFTREDAQRLIAVHCKAGKGRTGVMIAAYLLHTRQPEATTPDGTPSARLALQFFRAARTTDLDAVVQPSQVRRPSPPTGWLGGSFPEWF